MRQDELVEEIQDELDITSNSTYFSPDTIKKAINKALIWVSNINDLPQLEKVVGILSDEGAQYYDYPNSLEDDFIFKSDSIYMIEVGGDDKYDCLVFRSFKDEIKENTDSKCFASWNRKIFINPIPPAGTEINLYGTIEPKPLANDSDETPFGLTDVLMDQAIIYKAVSILLKKQDPATSQNYQTDATNNITIVYNKVRGKRQRKKNTVNGFMPHDFLA